jgi:hypothetical protein
MSVGSRSVMPTISARQPAFRARRDQLVTRLATCITVLTAAIAVLIVAAAAVAFTITYGKSSAGTGSAGGKGIADIIDRI